MTPLPVEIIEEIIAHVYYAHDTVVYPSLMTPRIPDYTTLSRCSLIDSRWRTVSQSLLFNHITGSAAPRLIKCFITSSSEHWKALMKHTRILDVSISALVPKVSSENLTMAPSLCIDSTEFIILMKQVSNLYELSISMPGTFSLEAALAELKRSTPASYPTHLKALRIADCSVQSPILYELLDFFPSIEFLKIQVEIVVPPPRLPAKFHLYDLAMFRTLSTEITTWLLSSSRDTLCILELRDLPSAGVTDLLVREYGRQLLSFRTMRYNMSTAKILHSCNNLQEFMILGLPSVPTLSIQNFPVTLEHFSLVHRHSDPSMDIADVIILIKTLLNLKLLSFDRKLKDDPQYGMFEDICGRKGIEVESSEYGHWPVC